MDNQRRVHPLIFYFPTILAVAIGIGIVVYLVVNAVDSGDSEPDSTLGEFGARYLAKAEYSRQENNTVGSAVCDALEYRDDEDLWVIECRFEREAEREITVWEVEPDQTVTRIETRYEDL